jgi:hypothetical protein
VTRGERVVVGRIAVDGGCVGIGADEIGAVDVVDYSVAVIVEAVFGDLAGVGQATLARSGCSKR